jgi:cytochrome d ubiquinol oxidase subunit I
VALTIPLTVAALATIAEGPIGDWAARDVASTQPIKLAAMEGLYKTTKGAPEHLLGWYTGNHLEYAIQIPHLLSLLTDHSWNGTVQGLATVPPSQRPPVNVVHWSFQIMVGIGTLLALLAVVYLAIWIWKKRLPESTWFYRALVVAGPLAVAALISGWVVTEVGRQPWVVYGVMRTDAAVTGAHGIPIGYGALAAAYLVVACGLAWALRRLARAPFEEPVEPPAQLQAA